MASSIGMTEDEAAKVAAIALTADNRCHVCADALLESLEVDFPAFNWHDLARKTDPDWRGDEEDG